MNKKPFSPFRFQKSKKSKKSEKKNSSKLKTLTGIMKRHPGGFGFVIPEKSKEQDIYIPSSGIGTALTNDRVEVYLTERNKSRIYGSVKTILKRHWEFVSGPYEISKGKAVLKNHGLGAGQPIELQNPLNLPVKKGEWVKVKITHFPEAFSSFKGTIVKILGVITSIPKDDNLRILAKNHIALDFSQEIQEKVKKIPDEVKEKDFLGRKDLRSKFFVTIDGATAKDFDDSIFVESLSSRSFRLFVAIADVSHYVEEGSALDREAFLRGNSTYLLNFVSPMLPEKLSHHLCSLNPHVPRLTVVAEMEFDSEGNMTKSSFYEAVIKSRKRLTYGEAQEIIDGQASPEKCPFLETAKQLADILIKKQTTEGVLDFNLPETVIKVNDRGVPLDVMKGHRLFSHRLIEQFMLAANKAVASFLKEKSCSFLYRIHDSPDRKKLQQLEIFSQNLGHPISVHSRKGLLMLLKQFKNHPKEQLINKLILRSLAQACYSAHNKGHYGLHTSLYTHFTSPIRRYCDLMIHRLLKTTLKGITLSTNKKELENKGTFISEREQISVKAERQVHDIKKARFLKKYLGENFEGTVSSVTSFGLFVTLKNFDIEGLIRFRDLPGHWVWDEIHLRAVASRSHYALSFGDEVTVQIIHVDEINGHIDFKLLSHKNKKLPKKAIQNKRKRNLTHSRHKNRKNRKLRRKKILY